MALRITNRYHCDYQLLPQLQSNILPIVAIVVANYDNRLAITNNIDFRDERSLDAGEASVFCLGNSIFGRVHIDSLIRQQDL